MPVDQGSRRAQAGVVIPETATSSTQASTGRCPCLPVPAVIPQGSGSRRSAHVPWPSGPVASAPAPCRPVPFGLWQLGEVAPADVGGSDALRCAAGVFNSPNGRHGRRAAKKAAGLAGRRWRGPGRTGQPAPGTVCPCGLAGFSNGRSIGVPWSPHVPRPNARWWGSWEQQRKCCGRSGERQILG